LRYGRREEKEKGRSKGRERKRVRKQKGKKFTEGTIKPHTTEWRKDIYTPKVRLPIRKQERTNVPA